MADSFFLNLADAVVALLNGNVENFPQPFAAQRMYDPLRQLGELETLQVDVILADRKQQILDRTRQQHDPRIEILFRQKIRAAEGSQEWINQLDALVYLVEEVDAFLSAPANRVPVAYAKWQESELVYPFVPQHLRSAQQFSSLVRVRYAVFTSYP